MNRIELKANHDHSKYSKKDIEDGIASGNYSVEIKDGSVSITVFAEEHIENIDERTNNVQEMEENQPKTPLYESQLLRLGAEKGVKVTRKYTKRADWNAPDLPAGHELNRPDTRFQTRIDNDTNELVEKFIQATGMTKKEFARLAFRAYINQREFNND